MPSSESLPRSVADVLDDNATFEAEALAAVRSLARSKPWRGTVDERLDKFQACVNQLCAAYSLAPITVIRKGRSSGPISGAVDPERRAIIYASDSDWLSVVTLLHLFSAMRGMKPFARFRWSINLFRRCFPISYGRCVHVGPFLVTAAKARQLGLVTSGREQA